MRRISVALGLVGVVGLATLALPAAGEHTGQGDPNDTRGPLDVRVVRLSHEDGPPTWRIGTFARWSARKIWDRGYLIVELDTKRDEGADHLAVVRSDGRRLLGDLYRLRRDGKQARIGALRAGKAGARGAWVAVPLHKLSIGASRTSYRWSVLTSWTAAGCERACFDLVPDAGAVEQPLPGVTPTPSPTVSPSPTPSP
ncbi:MAG TPA: hypothetical protein VF029_02160 [Actinomycetota bacterium]